MKITRIFLLCLLSTGISYLSFSQNNINEEYLRKVDKEVEKWMDEGKIPGLSLVLIDSSRQIIRTYGYSDISARKPVTGQTLFQLGSCSKAFTALAVQKLANEGLIHLDAYVSDYIPWLRPKYKDSLVRITILQLLHHTSGIPWQSIATIPESTDPDALEQTIRNVANIDLHALPGKRYEYATINYDILALIIQRITHQPFEDYLQKNVLNELHLHHTTIGYPFDNSLMSKGYKIGFFKPREYSAPVYKGNNAAGYVISNADDIARWLRFQMGMGDSGLYKLAELTHHRDETVPLHNMSSYGMGWEISLSGNGEINHGGLNPDFTSYIAFRPNRQLGVALLANSNSSFTPVLGNRLIKLLAGEKIGREFDPGDGNDRVYSIGCFILGFYILVVFSFLIRIMVHIIIGKRVYEGISFPKLAKFLLAIVFAGPFLYGLYILPFVLGGFTWKSLLVWSPVSLIILSKLLLGALGISFLVYFIGLVFPEKNKFIKIAPQILLISILSGIANMVVIILVTSALSSGIRLRYLVFYYALALCVYLLGRRFVQIGLTRFTRELIYDLRIKLIGKIFSTSYQKFEKIDGGRLYTALNDDVETIGGSADQFIMLITNVFTTVGCFLYLASIAFWTTLLTFLMIVSITTVYYIVSKSTSVYYNEARNIRNTFIRLVNGMTNGFKEISLHRNKRNEYKADISRTAWEHKEKVTIANIRFANAFLIGESLLMLLLGLIAFAIPRIFPGMQTYIIMNFIIVILYLIGPVNGILAAVPSILQLKIAWNRIQNFLKEIPANLNLEAPVGPMETHIRTIKAEGLIFQYKNNSEKNSFSVGPIDLEVKAGEILFIIGGNGSGKTTLAKLLTGLYEPDDGRLLINDRVIESAQISEYFSVVFSPACLFEKLYNIDVKKKSEEVDKYLKILD